MNPRNPILDRRTVVAGAGALATAAALAACTTYGEGGSAEPPAPAPAPGPGGGPPVLAKTADVPVGGGVVVGDTVVTQPTAGTFVGLDSRCTHAGCRVREVSGGTVNCACHGSAFALDGAVVTGPATQPLATKAVRVEGDSIVAG
ncbi:Rieske (2Fe-2S) protein [Nocardia puris]|uniref:Rieske Fe-S protein n=1 Tax=Nocardia puris TaxID=208602 RepID=A0A366DJ57_9NOCA|nr:Rieske (2Fe-2S) protein [Nocardia puris]MBF6212874.1 Rieske (2Fe-2S) protein [Nocardia puris]MBF6367865.1 Rieske (2Fe-2S) protein [Nocardia puris]MBF6463214.1 Rieske (2Fe-2S) protein [Nocardia puris]RBO90120.1 Rieske Fe-S protein [Nocardia puris]